MFSFCLKTQLLIAPSGAEASQWVIQFICNIYGEVFGIGFCWWWPMVMNLIENIESKELYEVFSAHPINLLHTGGNSDQNLLTYILVNHYQPCQHFSQFWSLTNSAKSIIQWKSGTQQYQNDSVQRQRKFSCLTCSPPVSKPQFSNGSNS